MSNYYNRQWRLPNNENKDKQSNYSMDFNNVLGIETSLDVNEFSEITFSFWFKTSTQQNSKYIISMPDGVGANGVEATFTNTAVRYRLTGQTTDTSIDATFTYYDNNWHHIVCTYDGTTQKIYVDGSLSNSGSANNGTLKTNYNKLYIGSFNWVYGLGPDVTLDGVSIYNYELSSSQVTTLYGSSSTGIGNPMSLSPAPVAFYPLGDQDSFNGAEYLTPNSSLKDYVFDFLTSNSYIDTNFTLPASYTSYSYSIWYKQTSSFTGDNYLIGNWNQGSSAIADMRVSVRFNGGTKLRIITGNNTTAFQSTDLDVSTLLLDGNWHHIAITVVSGEIKLYIDKNLEATHSNSNIVTGIVANRSYALGFSGNTSYSGYLDNSQLSNFQIFNTALSATGSNSVETLYNNGSPLTSMSGFTSLQGWWKLDASATYDSSTTTWTIPDSSSNSNTGTSSGMTQANLVQSDLSFTSGYSPYALAFDGTNDYIDCGSPSTLDFERTDAFSISAWVKRVGSGTTQFIFSKATNSSPYTGYSIYINPSNQITSNINISYSSNHLSVNGNSTLNTSWNHVCVTYDGSSNASGIKLYINGSEETTSSTGQASITGTLSNSYPVNIAARNSTDLFFNGSISNVSIWNVALTSAQVSEIYNEGVPSNLNNHSAYSNLVSWWQLGSNSSFNTNWTVLDEKGSNDGTSVNMDEVDIVDGVGSYANGLSSGMGGDEVIGDAPYSSSNSLSVNMDVEDRVSDTPS